MIAAHALVAALRCRRAVALWGALWAGSDATEVALTLGALALLGAVVVRG